MRRFSSTDDLKIAICLVICQLHTESLSDVIYAYKDLRFPAEGASCSSAGILVYDVLYSTYTESKIVHHQIQHF